VDFGFEVYGDKARLSENKDVMPIKLERALDFF
jgi:hypothetical protein